MKILVYKHGDGYKAMTEDFPARWEYGNTRAEAVYQLMITLELIELKD